MKWKQIYEDRLLKIDEIVNKIPKKASIVISHAAAEPRAILREMVKQKERFEDINIISGLIMLDAPYCEPGMEDTFHYSTFFATGATRDAIKKGRSEFFPCFFSEFPKLLHQKIQPDVAILHITPPDEYGYCSFGVSTDYQRAALESAKIVIAQINNKMPRILGDTSVHVSEIDYFVNVSEELPTLQAPVISDVERAIGKYCASLIKDGDTLQLGIGAIPDAVLSFLADKKDLGIHSEMISDGAINLIKSGAINNINKTLHKGTSVCTFIMGSSETYEFLNNNPGITLYPVDYTNNPNIIALNDNLVTINSCLQVDLNGQVNAEMIGNVQYSGVGGQMDFVRGANMSKGGRNIISTSSTARKGTISRIVAKFSEGTTVTTSRYDVDYIVTEYGIAHLKGKTLSERAAALIEIAHPDFRKILYNEYKLNHN